MTFSEADAVMAGYERAKRDKVELLIHVRDGQIRVRAKHVAIYDYPVPIIKGSNTELSVDIKSLGVRVHGGATVWMKLLRSFSPSPKKTSCTFFELCAATIDVPGRYGAADATPGLDLPFRLEKASRTGECAAQRRGRCPRGA